MMESVVFSLRVQTAPSASLMFTKSLLNIILLIALFLLYVLSTVNSAASKVFFFLYILCLVRVGDGFVLKECSTLLDMELKAVASSLRNKKF